jgi:hypothetical protein
MKALRSESVINAWSKAPAYAMKPEAGDLMLMDDCDQLFAEAVKLDALTADQPMAVEEAVALKHLAKAAYELKLCSRAQANQRIAMLTVELKLLDEPPLGGAYPGPTCHQL